MDKDNYNGWANYATWRVHREFFNGMDAHDTRDQIAGMSLYEIAAHAKETAREFIYDTLPDHNNRGQLTPAGMVSGWAAAFLDEVDWREIAGHLREDAGLNDQAKQP